MSASYAMDDELDAEERRSPAGSVTEQLRSLVPMSQLPVSPRRSGRCPLRVVDGKIVRGWSSDADLCFAEEETLP
jgi:hypothetical protein